MLSSGTLNLKFMQRKPNPNIKPKLEEERNRAPEPAKPLQHSTKDPQASRGQGRATTSQSSSSSSTAPALDRLRQSSTTPTLTIICEESLISFPWLSCRRTTSIPPAATDADTLPAHIGRKSYGEFNKAIQKLEEEPPLAASNKRSQPESSTAQSSRTDSKKPKTHSRPPPATSDQKEREGPRSGDKMAPRYERDTDNKRVSKKKKKQEGDAEESARAFKKPFTATTIKTKRKTVVDLTAPSGDGPCTSKTKRTTIETASSSKQFKNHNCQSNTRQQQQQQHRESIVIPDDHSGPESDDNEMVNRQIDLMFQEARKAQIT